MTKRERVTEALAIRNRACEQAEIDYREAVSKLQLPRFPFDWTDAMRAEADRQEMLITPILDAYHAARCAAWYKYSQAKGG